jgi:hypothetical protein
MASFTFRPLCLRRPYDRRQCGPESAGNQTPVIHLVACYFADSAVRTHDNPNPRKEFIIIRLIIIIIITTLLLL